MLLILSLGIFLLHCRFGHELNVSYRKIISVLFSAILLIWVILLFIDCWMVIKINDDFICVSIFVFKLAAIRWVDIVKMTQKQTNQFTNFVQCQVIILSSISGSKIKIPKKINNYNLFIEFLGKIRPDINFN
jgi:hypothetical protein